MPDTPTIAWFQRRGELTLALTCRGAEGEPTLRICPQELDLSWNDMREGTGLEAIGKAIGLGALHGLQKLNLINCTAIKTLVALLVPESDAQTLAVACHDIGEFVKHHPEGRRLMTQFGAKLAVMSILKHSDPEVQKHALTAVQRLMVINWDLLAVGK